MATIHIMAMVINMAMISRDVCSVKPTQSLERDGLDTNVRKRS
jgi:hypothetical protein